MAVNYNPKIVTSGLVLCLDAANTKSYPGTGTTLTDLSGRGNNGTLTNGPTFNTINGGRIVLDGSNDHVVIADNNIFDFGTGDFTFELWCYPLSVTANRGLVLFRSYTGVDPGIYFYADGGKLSVYTTTTFSESGTSLTANSWNHIVLSRISGTSRIYKNTTLVDQRAFTFNIAVNTHVAIGYDTQYSNDPFSGYISSVKIYASKGLTADEVQQNFQALRGRFGI